MNGLVTVNTDVNYPFWDGVFELRQYAGLVEFKDNYETAIENIIPQPPDDSKTTENVKIDNFSIDEHFNNDEKQ